MTKKTNVFITKKIIFPISILILLFAGCKKSKENGFYFNNEKKFLMQLLMDSAELKPLEKNNEDELRITFFESNEINLLLLIKNFKQTIKIEAFYHSPFAFTGNTIKNNNKDYRIYFLDKDSIVKKNTGNLKEFSESLKKCFELKYDTTYSKKQTEVKSISSHHEIYIELIENNEYYKFLAINPWSINKPDKCNLALMTALDYFNNNVLEKNKHFNHYFNTISDSTWPLWGIRF